MLEHIKNFGTGLLVVLVAGAALLLIAQCLNFFGSWLGTVVIGPITGVYNAPWIANVLTGFFGLAAIFGIITAITSIGRSYRPAEREGEPE